jgi:hypothetical protein
LVSGGVGELVEIRALAEIRRQVCVTVDQAGEAERTAQIDHLRAVRGDEAVVDAGYAALVDDK